MSLLIRSEAPGDEPSIRRVHEAAFPGLGEADLVDALRRDGDLDLSLVAEQGGIVVGHIGFSPMTAEPGILRARALAPVAVLPDRQGSGVGTALICAGLERLASAGTQLVLVLGDPAFYVRFGFSAEAARSFETPYDGPYLQALVLDERARMAARLTYAPAFAGLE